MEKIMSISNPKQTLRDTKSLNYLGSHSNSMEAAAHFAQLAPITSALPGDWAGILYALLCTSSIKSIADERYLIK